MITFQTVIFPLETPGTRTCAMTCPDGLRTTVGIALLAAYITMLGIGVVGEIWHIEWILNLPLYNL